MLSAEFLQAARAICGAAQVIDGPDIEPRYLEAARYGAGPVTGRIRAYVLTAGL